MMETPIEIPQAMSPEKLREMITAYEERRRVALRKKHQITLVDEQTALGPLMQKLERSPLYYNYNPLELVEAFEKVKKVGFVWLSYAFDEALLVYYDALIDPEGFKAKYPEGVTYCEYTDEEFTSGKFLEELKEPYRENLIEEDMQNQAWE